LAFPSRMTIGMLVELLAGRKVTSSSKLNSISAKRALCFDENSGDENNFDKKRCKPPPDSIYSEFKGDMDATPFDKSFSIDKIRRELKSLGFNQFGNERMINGETGKPMKCLIFVGICYYQRLRHMVIDKVHARSRGGRTVLSRQPPEGRKQGGGFRIGCERFMAEVKNKILASFRRRKQHIQIQGKTRN